MRSPKSIMAELTYWYERGYRRFSFADDNFTLQKERVVALCEEIKERSWPDLVLSCDNGVRADRVDYSLLKLMREAGFVRLAFGVEAGNNKVLKLLHKHEDIEAISARIKDACDLGYEVTLFFLVGSPGETWEDLQDSFRLALQYPIGIAYFYNIIPFPNTTLFQWIKENGKLLREPEDYLNDYPIMDNEPVFETVEMPYQMRKKALRQAFAITRMTMRRTWERRLAKYGFLGKSLAALYCSGVVQDRLLRQRLLRQWIYKLANLFFE